MCLPVRSRCFVIRDASTTLALLVSSRMRRSSDRSSCPASSCRSHGHPRRTGAARPDGRLPSRRTRAQGLSPHFPNWAVLGRTAPPAIPPGRGWPASISKQYPEAPAPKVHGADGFREEGRARSWRRRGNGGSTPRHSTATCRAGREHAPWHPLLQPTDTTRSLARDRGGRTSPRGRRKKAAWNDAYMLQIIANKAHA